MTVQLLDRSAIAPKFKFTTQQYQLMHEAGFFGDGDRLELINGEVKPMSPIGRKHLLVLFDLTNSSKKNLAIALWFQRKTQFA